MLGIRVRADKREEAATPHCLEKRNFSRVCALFLFRVPGSCLPLVRSQVTAARERSSSTYPPARTHPTPLASATIASLPCGPDLSARSEVPAASCGPIGLRSVVRSGPRAQYALATPASSRVPEARVKCGNGVRCFEQAPGARSWRRRPSQTGRNWVRRVAVGVATGRFQSGWLLRGSATVTVVPSDWSSAIQISPS